MKVIEVCVMPGGWTGIIEQWGGHSPPEYLTESLAMAGNIGLLYAAPNSNVWVRVEYPKSPECPDGQISHYMVQRGYISWARIIDYEI